MADEGCDQQKGEKTVPAVLEWLQAMAEHGRVGTAEHRQAGIWFDPMALPGWLIASRQTLPESVMGRGLENRTWNRCVRGRLITLAVSYVIL
jgi:hypothetical protein